MLIVALAEQRALLLSASYSSRILFQTPEAETRFKQKERNRQDQDDREQYYGPFYLLLFPLYHGDKQVTQIPATVQRIRAPDDRLSPASIRPLDVVT